MNDTDWVVTCFGITKDPETNNFMMVMQYARNGSLRRHLDNEFNSLKWENKLSILSKIAKGLKNIHDNGLIHQDFHCGNILNKDQNNVNKSVVFSQWTSFLDLVALAFKDANIQFVRYEGNMLCEQHDKTITDFSNDPKIKVFLD